MHWTATALLSHSNRFAVNKPAVMLLNNQQAANSNQKNQLRVEAVRREPEQSKNHHRRRSGFSL
jgi:hypothetical protein